MKTIAILCLTIFTAAFSTAFATDRTTKNEILQMTNEINQGVRNYEFSDEQLDELHAGLTATLDAVYNENNGSTLICSKQGNAMFYPTSATSGEIVGSTSSNAGYSNFEDCRANLPKRGEKIACFKQGNAMFYPTNAESGAIIGSTSSNAGHSQASTCRLTLPARRAKIACYKQGNAMYYPSNPATGEIIGSSSSNAGYSDLNSCLKVINQ